MENKTLKAKEIKILANELKERTFILDDIYNIRKIIISALIDAAESGKRCKSVLTKVCRVSDDELYLLFLDVVSYLYEVPLIVGGNTLYFDRDSWWKILFDDALNKIGQGGYILECDSNSARIRLNTLR